LTLYNEEKKVCLLHKCVRLMQDENDKEQCKNIPSEVTDFR